MADVPEFLQVPNGPRVAMSGLSPEYQQRLLTQYEASPVQDALGAAQAGGFSTLASPPVDATAAGITDQQRASLQNTYRPLVNASSPQDQLATANAIEQARAGGFSLAPESQAPAVAPTNTPAGTSPPAGPAGGPLGMASAMFKGSYPSGSPAGMPGLGSDRELRKAFEDKNKADAAAYEAGRSTVAQAAGMQDEFARQQEAAIQKGQERQAQQQKYEDEQANLVKQAMAEKQKPGQPVDPDRFWKGRNTGQKILAGVAVFLSGLGQGLQGRGGNASLEMIQKQIDDDIQLQKESASDDKERKRDAVTDANNVYRMMLDKGMNATQAEAAARVVSAQMLDAKLNALASKNKVDTYAAGFDQLKAANGIALQGAVQQFKTANAQAFGTIASGQAALMNANTNRMELGLKAATTGGRDPSVYVPGVGNALDKDAAKEARDTVRMHGITVGKLDRLMKLRTRFGGESLNRDAVAAMKSLSTELIGALNKQQKFGALDKGTQELLTQMQGGDVTSFGPGVDSALRSVRQSLDEDLEAGLKPYMATREKNQGYFEGKLEAFK